MQALQAYADPVLASNAQSLFIKDDTIAAPHSRTSPSFSLGGPLPRRM